MQIDLNSPFREPQGLTTLRNSDQIDSGSSARSVRDKKTLLRVVVNYTLLDFVYAQFG